MKAIISTTYNDTYLFCLPIVVWCWNKLGVDVVCFKPYFPPQFQIKNQLVHDTINGLGMNHLNVNFDAPEHKQATYAQCSRLYAGALHEIPNDEILITSDVDMAVFKVPPIPSKKYDFTIFGADLTPDGQYPVCYVAGEKVVWEAYFRGYRSYQELLDQLLGEIECDNFRGNYWAKDQEELWRVLQVSKNEEINRAKPGTQFASNRYDRDDAFLLDRLSPDTIDYHLPRPLYEDKNFAQLLTVLGYHYPNEDFMWLINYRYEYMKLL